jgi:hypothetical protein
LTQPLRGTAGQVGFLFEKLLLHGGTVFEHVGTGLEAWLWCTRRCRG